MKYMLPIFLLAAWGCAQKSVTEEDRQGVEVIYQIIEQQDDELDRMEEAAAEDPVIKEKFGNHIVNLRQRNDDSRTLIVAYKNSFGPPKDMPAYTHDNVKHLADEIEKSHRKSTWAWLGGALLSGGALALAAARSPFARMIPGFGPVFTALDTTLAGVETWMQKKKENGDHVDAAELAGILQAAHADANVGPYIDKLLAKVKVKLPDASPTPPSAS